MINTSELQVNTVIDGARGQDAHERIIAAFERSLEQGI
jgi:hypothetical protein